MVKKFSLILITLFIGLFVYAESPYFYYYKGQKQYLELDVKYAFVVAETPQVFQDIKNSKMNIAEIEKYKIDIKHSPALNKEQFRAEIQFDEDFLSDEDYFNRLSELRQQNKNIIVSPYFKTKENDKIALSNIFYVKLKQLADTILLRREADKNNSIIVKQDKFMPLWYSLSITFPSSLNALETCNLFYDTRLFECTEPELLQGNLLHCSDDTWFEDQWGLSNTGQYGGTAGMDIKACSAWGISRGGGITVAVIDQGIQMDHPDLNGALHPMSYDADADVSPSRIRGNHGIACAGILGARGNNNRGITGVAPECTLMSISASINGSSPQQLASGFNFAWQNGADVISNSWGGGTRSAFLDDAIDNAVTLGRNGLGCIVVFSSGNRNHSYVNYPAELSNVIAVGAISQCGQRKSPNSCDTESDWGSQYGTALDVVAPGVLIPTTDRTANNGYNPFINIHTDSGGSLSIQEYADRDYTRFFNGTSAACPHVAASQR